MYAYTFIIVVMIIIIDLKCKAHDQLNALLRGAPPCVSAEELQQAKEAHTSAVSFLAAEAAKMPPAADLLREQAELQQRLLGITANESVELLGVVIRGSHVFFHPASHIASASVAALHPGTYVHAEMNMSTKTIDKISVL